MPTAECRLQPHPVHGHAICRSFFVPSLAFLKQGFAPGWALPHAGLNPLSSLSLLSSRIIGLYHHVHFAETFVKRCKFVVSSREGKIKKKHS